jgi:hypothetical protein
MLLAFLPAASGCSRTVTRPIDHEPRDTAASGEAVPILAYTDRDGVRHPWEGTIQVCGRDSLLLASTAVTAQWWGTTAEVDTVKLRLARRDVLSVDMESDDVLASSFSVWVVAIGIAVLVGVAYGAARDDID